jgi:hypothetical protein
VRSMLSSTTFERLRSMHPATLNPPSVIFCVRVVHRGAAVTLNDCGTFSMRPTRVASAGIRDRHFESGTKGRV